MREKQSDVAKRRDEALEHDPTRDPKFQRVVKHFLDSPPKPRMPKASTRRKAAANGITKGHDRTGGPEGG